MVGRSVGNKREFFARRGRGNDDVELRSNVAKIPAINYARRGSISRACLKEYLLAHSRSNVGEFERIIIYRYFCERASARARRGRPTILTG